MSCTNAQPVGSVCLYMSVSVCLSVVLSVCRSVVLSVCRLSLLLFCFSYETSLLLMYFFNISFPCQKILLVSCYCSLCFCNFLWFLFIYFLFCYYLTIGSSSFTFKKRILFCFSVNKVATTAYVPDHYYFHLPLSSLNKLP